MKKIEEKEKKGMAYLEMFLMIISVFAFSFLVSIPDSAVVKAQEVTSCCERTTYGAWCQNAKAEECDSDYKSASTSCDSTSYCKLGCCYDSGEGVCMENTPQRVCDDANGHWEDSPSCEIPQCNLGCCVIGTQAAFVTLTRCKKLSSFYGLGIDFRKNINDETECIAVAASEDQGACVYETDYIKTCKFGTRQECNSIKPVNGTMTSETEFFKDLLCSAEELGADCGPSKKTICVEGKDEVYFIDTCGNPANIYDASKVNDKSYWREIVPKSESCGAGNTNGNANSGSCGNCDYFYGSYCKKASGGKRATYGDNICADLNCKDNRHGESWCVYDGEVGEGKDTVGSRHWRQICMNNEIILEPCDDYRQTICIEDSIDTGHGEFLQSGCRANRWQDCRSQSEKIDCENTDKRDCRWIAEDDEVDTTEPEQGEPSVPEEVACVPEFPPGLRFWDEGEAQGICAQANTQCIITYEEGVFGEAEPIDNEECLEDSWADEQNEICTSLGDCGSKTNFIGAEGHKEGYKIKSTAVGEVILTALAISIAAGGNWLLVGDVVSGLGNPSTMPGPGSSGSGAATTSSGGAGSAGTGFGAWLHAHPVIDSLFWAVIVGGAASLIASFIFPEGNAGMAAFVAGSIGTAVGVGSARLGWLSGAWPWVVGIGVGVVIFLLMYKEENQEIITFECFPWEAPTGGNDCEKCNKDEMKPCSEYRCASLGQACEIVNPGTAKEMCVWVNPRDVKSPGISPWDFVLTEGYNYTDVRIRPPGDGSEPGRMRVVRDEVDDGCVKAFEPLSFGIVTIGPDGKSEPAQCKIDYDPKTNFSDMRFYFGESNMYLYNHSQTMRLPGPDHVNANAESPEIINDGNYNLYVRCQDRNGNVNHDAFVISFCVDEGPDVTPPKVEGTSIENGAYIQYDLSETPLEVYLNEPSQCRWSRLDQDYENMDQEMSCSTNIWEMNNQMLYKCTTTLTGLVNRQDNGYYFRCKDQPWLGESSDRNVMRQSYKFILKGSQPLNIIDIGPNATIRGAGNFVPVNLELKTSNGCCIGDATCYYSPTGESGTWIEFFETGTNLHKQRLDLADGDYTYYFQCTDLGGNTDYDNTEFIVIIDKGEPVVVRVYVDGVKLKIITDEDSTCTYSETDCDFNINDGINMPYADSEEHYADWSIDTTYYIRCKDDAGNQPIPTECSIIVRGYEFS